MNEQERQHIIDLLDRHVLENGNPVLLSDIGTLLKNDSKAAVTRASYSSLSALVDDLAPEFRQILDSRGVNWVESTRQARNEILPTPDGIPGYPWIIGDDDPLIASEIEKMHEFAFMGWWNSIYKRLKQLTGYSGNDPSMWTRIIARELSIARASGGLMECTCDQQQLCLFRTRLTTQSGATIIAVLQANINFTPTPWYLKEYTYAGQENSEFGMWLLNSISPAFHGQAAGNTKAICWRMLESLQAEGESVMEDLTRVVGGYLLPLERISAIRVYLDSMTRVVHNLNPAWLSIPDPMTSTIAALTESVRPSGLLSTLAPLEKAMQELIRRIDHVLVTFLMHDTAREDHTLAIIQAFMSDAGGMIRSGGDATVYLQDYRNWISLLCNTARALWLKDTAHHEDIASHFRIPGPMLNLFAASQAPDSEEVQQVSAAITQLESCLDEFASAMEAVAAEAASNAADPLAEDLALPAFGSDEDAPALIGAESALTEADAALFSPLIDEGSHIPGDDEAALAPGQDLLAALTRRAAAPVAPAAPQDAPASAGTEEIPTERVTLSDNIDQHLRDQARSGSLDAEEELMYLGAWTPGLHGEPVQSDTSAKALARLMLSEPSARTEENLVFCIQDALHRNGLPQAQALLSSLQAGWQRLLYDYLLTVRSLAESQYPVSRMSILTDELPGKLSRLLDQSNSLPYAVRREIILAVLAHMPLIISHCLYPVGITNLLSVLQEQQNLINDLGMARTLKDLRTFVASCSGAYQHNDLSAGLRKTYSATMQAAVIAQLQRQGRMMEDKFSNCTLTYRNAREVVQNFSRPDLERTHRMFNCLFSGQADPDLQPFEGDDEMRAYINEAQRYIGFGNAGDIGGPGMSGALRSLRELNNAYAELLDVSGASGPMAELSGWFRNGIEHLKDWNRTLQAALHNYMDDSPLQKYLMLLCGSIYPDFANPLESAFGYQRGDDSCWPFWDEDRLVTALFDLSGCTDALSTCELSRQMFFSCATDAEKLAHHRTLDQLAAVCDKLIHRCNTLLQQLNDLFTFNTIDQAEYKALIDSLSKTYGWLERTRDLLTTHPDDLSHCAPVVRYEICLWYVDNRISSLFNALTQSAKALLGQGNAPDSAQLLQDIDEAAAQRNIQFIADRFLDELTDATKLSPRPCYADHFFALNTQAALANLCSNKSEDWRNGHYVAPTDPSLRLYPIIATPDQSKSVGLALRYAGRYSQDSGGFSDDELAELRAMFAFLGFDSPELKQEGGSITLSFIAPERSVCPLPALGVGNAERRDNGEWRVTYRVRIMKDIDAVTALLATKNHVAPGGMCTILLCPFAVTFAERMKLKRQTHGTVASYNCFLLDKSFLRYAVCLPDAARLTAFYACASHLIRLNPYSTETNPKRWQDAFFGREKEILRLMSTTDCSVIYGGRRLGKTSIMRELEFRWNTTSSQHIAIYINLQYTTPFGMWYRIAEGMHPYIPEMVNYRTEAPTAEKVEQDAQEIRQLLINFMNREGVNLLLLLDECDTLVYTDTLLVVNDKNRVSRLHELIALRNTCSRNFKFILAGLQGVTRFVQHMDAFTLVRNTNDPVYQCLADAVRVRPLIETDSVSAYDLVDIPFRAMGYRLEHESILHILRVCCFRPNLIQNYCRCLLDALHSRHDLAFMEDSLYMHVPHQLVQSVENSSNYKDNHRRQGITIPLNAGSTAVYEPIAYAVALLSLRNSTKGRFTGFSALEVLELINSYNPAFTNNRPIAHDYIRTILSELAFMGVLREIGTDQRYVLFSSYILRLLGDSSTIEETLRASIDSHVHNRDNAPDRTELFSLRRIIDDFILPLNNGQLVTLNNALTEHGFAVITGSPMLSLESVTDMLQYIRFSQNPGRLHEMAAADLTDVDRMNGLLRDLAEDTDLNILLRGAWPENAISTIREIRSAHPNVRFILLVPPRTCMAQLDALAALPPETILHPTRLSLSSRMILFEAIASDRFQESDEMDNIRRISEATGDWPDLFNRLMNLIRSQPQDSFDDIMQAFSDSLSASEMRTAMGLDEINPEVWRNLVEFDNLAEAIYMGRETSDLTIQDFLTTLNYLQHMDLADVTGDISPEAIEAELKAMEHGDSDEEDAPRREPCRVKLDAFACRLMAEGGREA